MMRHLCACVLATVMGCAYAPLARADDADAWQFDVVYQGLFSAGQPVDIADATLRSEALPDDLWSLGEIAISPVGHALAETLYRFRFRVRSLHDSELGSLAFERFKRDRKSTQEVWLLDLDSGRFLRYPKNGKGEALAEAIARKLAPGVAMKYQRERVALRVAPMFDQLSLFQRLRKLPYRLEASFGLFATDGKKVFNYQVSVVERSQLILRGHAWNTWKLQIESRHVNGKPAHQPILSWLDDSDARIPVRAEARHPIGNFILRLAGKDGEPVGLVGRSGGRNDPLPWRAAPMQGAAAGLRSLVARYPDV